MKHTRRFPLIGAAAAGLVLAAQAATGFAASASDLGKTLTPMGAEKAANADGSIPAWDGGLTKPVAGYAEGGHYPDPYAGDKLLFTIDGSNADQYASKLAPGQIALLKKYPDWKMNVYPTHRSASFPQAIYDATMQNPGRAKLAENDNGVIGTTAGVPFPIPDNGVQAIWNHILSYRGDSYEMNWAQAAVTRDGSYTPVRFEYKLDYSYNNLSKPDAERTPNLLTNFLQVVTAPARLAGQILLVQEFVDQARDPRKAWTYNPGQRRVRLAPDVGFDNPGTAADGLRTNDDFGMFSGSPERYDWALKGKQEMYIPYNSHRIMSDQVKVEDVLRPGHLNGDLARYELHRVWVVEATLKPGARHVYAKRTFYIDEDSWNVVETDKYDNRGQLWRVGEMHMVNWYNVPMMYGTLEVHHDLQSGRYLAMGLRNDEKIIFKTVKPDPSEFTPAGLRSIGTR